ncbi:MAG: immunoglobulin domain-containing protein, partial [Verrucomicrobiota bacterium]
MKRFLLSGQLPVLARIMAILAATTGLSLHAASPYAGFYVGYVYSSISGTITVPESPIGAAGFTVDNDGNITGNLTGVVDGSGNITWNANDGGFTTGTISGGVLASTTSQNNNGAISTFRIAANTTAGGFGGGGTVAHSLVWKRPSPSGAVMRGVTYGNNQFVAVGPAGSVAVSGNGTNWVAVNAVTTSQLNAVAYGNGVYVAVGDGATAISSTDGLTWTARSIGGIQNFVGVAYGNGTFVAVNLVNAVYTSTDGISWSAIASPPTGISFWNNLKYVGNMFVLVGATSTSGSIATSSDGTNWNAVKTLPSTGGIMDVTYGNSKWVGVNTTRYFSFTAADASDATSGTFSGLSDSVGFVNGVFVSDGRYYSTDGVTWKREGYPNIDINDMVTENGLLVAVGGAMTTTTDGKLWATHTKVLPLADVNNVGVNAVATGQYYDDITFFDGGGATRYARIGLNGSIEERTNTSLPYTNAVSPTTEHLRDALGASSIAIIVGNNGTILRFGGSVNAWTNVTSGTTGQLNSIDKGGSVYVIVGNGGVIRRSVNAGQTWSSISSGTGNNLNRVHYNANNGYFVAVGDNGTILKSNDGSSWSSLTSGTTRKLVGIGSRSSGNVNLVAVAEDSTVLVSENHGTTWRAITVNAPYAITWADGTTARGAGGFQMTTSDGTNWVYSLPQIGGLTGVAHGNGRVIINANSYRLASTDLENWTAVPVTYSHNGIAFGNGILVSVGTGLSPGGLGFVATSADGTKWIDRTTPTALLLNAVAYGQGKFAAVGSSGTILSSTDGVTWVNRTISGTQELRGIAYGNGTFVAVGASGVSRYSTDGETWTAGSPGGSLNAIAFGNGLFVAVGDSGAIRTSANGVNWTSRSASPSTTRSLRGIRYAGDRFVAVGDQDGSGNGAVVVHSTDGVNWTKEVSNIAVALQAASAGNGTFVAVGSGTLVSAPYQDTTSPNITGQPTPASQTVNAGVTVTYTATVVGSGLQYRWLKDGTPLADGPGISGAATATLQLTGVDALDAGVYQLSVWNDSGSALTQSLTLNVNGPPIITVHPVSVTTSNTMTTNFTVTAVGPGTLTYQWRKNGQPLSDGGHYSGTTTSKLIISSAAGADEATYDVIVSNAFGGSAPSDGATLTVNRPPTITQPPVAINITQGQTISLSVQVDGSPTLTYQWKRNGSNVTDGGRVSGATSPSLTITSATVADAGSYTVSVTNSFAPGVTSVSVFVSVLGPGALRPDFTFNGGGTTWDIVPTLDGKYAVGGDVSYFSGVTWSRLLKMDSNGVVVTTFATTNSTRIANSTIRTVAEQPDGQLVVGGGFWQWGGNGTYAYTVRLNADGVLDTTYIPAPAWTVQTIIPVANNKVLSARTGFGFATSWVSRYNSDGTKDNTFTEIVNSNRQLNNMALQSDGTIWMAGLFGLKKANADGTSPTSVTTYSPFPEMAWVHVGPNDKIYYSDNNGQYFGRLNADGSRDTSFNVTINGHVTDMGFLANGKLVIVGDFQTVNSVTSAYIAVLDDTGTLMNSFISPYTWAAGGTLYTIEMLGDGSALVGGNVQMTLPTNQKSVQRIQIEDPPAAGVSYSSWLTGKGLTTGVNDGLQDDPDGDGFANVVEYLFATDPNQGSSKPVFNLQTVTVSNQSYRSVNFTRLKDATDGAITVDASVNLNFSPLLGTDITVQDLGNGTERVTVRLTDPIT